MAALRERGFRRLWIAGLISDTGDWLLLVSVPIVVYQYTGSTLGTAAAFLVELIPPVLLAPIAGLLADRPDRRLVLTLTAAAQAVALLPLLLVDGRTGLPLVYAALALQSALASVFDPTEKALVPRLVGPDRLVSANSLVGLGENAGRLVGGSLGGVLLAAGGGLSVIVAVDAVSFLLTVGLIASLGAPRPAADDNLQSALHVSDGSGGTWRATLGIATVRQSLVVLFIASVAQGMFVVLFVVFVARILHGGPAEIGLLRGIQAIGAIGAGFALATSKRMRPGALVAWSAIAFGIIDLAIWNSPQLTAAEPPYVALFITVGAPGIALAVGLSSVMQRSTREGQRGKAFAAGGVAAALGEGLGIISAGVLGTSVGVVALLDVQGVLYLVAGLFATRWLARRGGSAIARSRARRAYG